MTFSRADFLPLKYDIDPKLKLKIRKLVKKAPSRAETLHKKIAQIINSDEATIERFKNLSNELKDRKRVHVDKSFVLTFRFIKEKKFVLFLDFDHHDRIYKK